MPRAVNTLLLFFIVLWLPAAAAAEKSILVLGDSLSAAYGIPRQRGWVALLEERLKRERPDYIVVNASISGDTSGGGRARLKPLLDKHRPAVLVIELGANDGLRVADHGVQVAAQEHHRHAAQASGARVLLIGMRMPPNYGEVYAQSFEDAFREIARTHRIALVPFLLEDFADKLELFLPDRIHPTAEAQPMMLERVWKELRPLLR
jgi:acyl-CoA thioesterase-1